VVAAAKIEPILITINVQMLSGPLPPIIISAEATVRDLKLRVQAINAAFAFDQQHLLIHQPDDAGAGIHLLNHRTLQSYHITESTNVVLVMSSSPTIEVWIDEALYDLNRFNASLSNQDLQATAISISSICSLNQAFLFRMFSENRAIQSVKIQGCWTEEHLEFCRAIMKERSDLDIRLVVEGKCDSMALQVVEFCKVSRCWCLDLDLVDIGRVRLRELAVSLQPMPFLQTLRLDLEEDHLNKRFCRALTVALQSMPLLHTFELLMASIDAAGVVTLAPTLSSLQSLSLFVSTGLADDVCIALSSLLQSSVSLRTLSLGFNEIGVTGCVALVPVLKSMSSLQYLGLGENCIGDKECMALAAALKSMSSLQTLDLVNNQICDEGCIVLAPALQSMTSLQNLSLSFNGIGSAGCLALASALELVPSLLTLNLSDNRIGAEGCAALAPALQSMPALRMLCLSGTLIGSQGCVALAHALNSMPSLLELDLCSNQICYNGCIALAPALQSLSSLQKFILSCNQIGAAGCVALAPALKSMVSLQTLDLGYNEIDIQVEEAFRSIFSSQSLHLRI
jgi:Ran GTPase-activating protein (RanGAP) involved in mRNA processing and transport